MFDAVHFGGKKIVVKQSSVEQRGIYIGIYIYNQRRLLILLLCSTMHALISCRAKFVYFFFLGLLLSFVCQFFCSHSCVLVVVVISLQDTPTHDR